MPVADERRILLQPIEMQKEEKKGDLIMEKRTIPALQDHQCAINVEGNNWRELRSKCEHQKQRRNDPSGAKEPSVLDYMELIEEKIMLFAQAPDENEIGFLIVETCNLIDETRLKLAEMVGQLGLGD